MTHCLVVDDSNVIRKVARRILESHGLEVTEAENGRQAVEQCLKKTPDAVLLDWLMPEMNGLEFLGAIRRSKLKPKPYSLYCTTENDPQIITRALAFGANVYLLKPFDRGTLEEKLGGAGLISPVAAPPP
ncbi:MAG: response regulator [Hyphomicrobiaceae bacterium]